MGRKLLTLGVFLVMALGLFAGCGNNKYNAVLYDNAAEWIHEEFLQENLTKGAKPLESDVPDDDADLPDFKTHIVTDIEKFNAIFKDFTPEVDFEKEMLIVYICTNIYMGSNYKLSSINLSDSILMVKVKRQTTGKVAHAASSPQQRCFVIKMDKNNIVTVNFTVS